jgi:hypothetical protein
MDKQPVTIKLELPSILIPYADDFRDGLTEEVTSAWLRHHAFTQKQADQIVIEITEQTKGKKS